MEDRCLGDAFSVLSCPFWSTALRLVWCSATETHLKLLDRALVALVFYQGVCLGVLIVDLSQYTVHAV